MPTNADILWFKKTYGPRLLPYLKDKPFTLDMMTALACQETGEVWPILRKVKALSADDILALCVGDTLDRDSTFPKDKDDLLSVAQGQDMFDIARQALVDMAQYVDGYKGAASNKKKFCKGFGLFQYDLQFFKTKEKDFFLEKVWATFDGTTTHALGELTGALTTLGLKGAKSLTDEQFAFAGIVYNTGKFIKSKGLDQGYVSDGKHYGRNLFELIAKVRGVAWTPPVPSIAPHAAGLMSMAAAGAAVPAGFPQRLVDAAMSQWALFGKQEYDINGDLTVGGHKEGEDGFYQKIGDYWLTGTDTHGIDGRDHGSYWSAAFISWCEKKAGADNKFRYSTQHSVYIAQAIRDHLNNRLEAGYWGWRLNEGKPAVGDLVCWTRKAGIDFDHQNHGDYPGHADIVIDVTAQQAVVIGGNVGDSVTRRPLALDSKGFLKPVTQHGETLFGLMKCRLG